jgi:hypothetical protein
MGEKDHRFVIFLCFMLNPSIPLKHLKKTLSLALPSMGEDPPFEYFSSSSSGKKEYKYRYMYLIGVSE